METANTLHVLALFIGHNIGDAPTHSVDSVADACVNVLNIDGATFSECVGIWRGMRETSTRCEFVVDSNECARILSRVPALCAALEQDAMLATIDGARPRFIERR